MAKHGEGHGSGSDGHGRGEDLGASPAHYTNGQGLRLPRQFFESPPTSTPADGFLQDLRRSLDSCRYTIPPPPHHQLQAPISRHNWLKPLTFSFAETQYHRLSRLDGAFKVLSRARDFFTLDLNGRIDTVSIHRLKPVFGVARICSSFTDPLFLLTLIAVCAIDMVPAQGNLTKSSIYVMNSFLAPGEKCGKQTITGWTVIREILQIPTMAKPIKDPLNFNPTTGIFTPPFRGYFHVCASFRIKKGSHGDFIIVKGTSSATVETTTDIQGAFGSVCPVTCDWSSHQQCVLIRGGPDTPIAVRLMSGGAADCEETTEWRYAKFDIFSVVSED
eukprot:maker-scaffold1742_size29367-snap-gene-0.4 protein:Tk10774 transcript:maker-scaffold1742_size29367-snap-gene-0.4-mRNA-1 annotation:"PREDICTED: uncharacterized protein K02A2.6-like"